MDSQREKQEARRQEKAATPVLKLVIIAPAGFIRQAAEDVVEKAKRKLISKLVGKDSIRIHGEAEVKHETPGECRVKGCGCGFVHFVARNKIVGQGLRHIHNMMSQGFLYTDTVGAIGTFDAYPRIFETNVQSRSSMRLGLGTAATTEGMTGLTGQITTAPNSTAVAYDNPSTGVYRTKFTAVWNAGALAVNTITEIAILGYILTTFATQPYSANAVAQNGTALGMFARLTSTDGEFVAFTINTSVPLTVEYRVVLTFV